MRLQFAVRPSLIFAAVVLALILFSTSALSAELKVSGDIENNLVHVLIENKASYSVPYNFKAELKTRSDEKWVLEKTVKEISNASLAPKSKEAIDINFTFPEAKGEYKIFLKADITNGTYTYTDLKFSVGDAGPHLDKPESGAGVKIISAPDVVKTGEEFTIIAEIESYSDQKLEVYSYVYGNRRCLSLWGWDGNKVKLDFTKGEIKQINLSDSVAHSTSNGTYSLTVRARGEKDWDKKMEIRIVQSPQNLSKELSLPHDFSSEEDGLFNPEILFPLIALIPLALIILKRLF